ncbi:LysR family transcriptional regulator ArgP [Corynebacterium epidermidicanis]|uniref:Transcriptional regulator, ArgP family n=1 Tax=Corynebacterium epidermidicanis TaxID=1050174 RepID=A0A0G3GQU6_9CORY|nr:LysR family transcriptional regulator ArgP [Corynebacterium epidermidicanis]AKK02945.1 transcriptional regulator, ArgP family [Corynebacterium epidermidicanis]
MNQTHLATLLAVLEEGSFDAAADVLGISPSAVSQRIKALESDIGRVLVRRSSPVVATESGEVLAQAARRMALLQAETDVALRRTIARVPLSIAINADSLATWFQPVFSEVAKWDNATLRLRIEDESRSMMLLRRGDCLGAITTEATAVQGCEVRHLGVLRYRAMASPALRDAYTDRTGTIDWAHMPTLRYGPNDKLQTNDLDGRLEGKPVNRRVSEIPSSEAFLEAARRGLGWALVAELQGRELVESGDLVLLDDIVSDVHLYWQYWRLESTMLHDLTAAVVTAAAEALD